MPALAIGEPKGKPDLQVRQWDASGAENSPSARAAFQPDAVGTLTLERPARDVSLLVERHGKLIASIELVSPRNKDRPEAREVYGRRYLSYLRAGVNLLLVDVHPRPVIFSFAEVLRQKTSIERQPCPPPCAISYRVGQPLVDEERPSLELWERQLTIGQPLPSIALPLESELAILVELEPSYAQATADAYLE